MRHRTISAALPRSRRAAAILSGIVLAAMAVPQAVPLAHAEDVPGHFASWDALYQEQQNMDTTADALRADPGSVTEGLAGLVAAPDQRRMTVYWHGELTAGARDAIKRSTVPVDVKQAPNTAQQMAVVEKDLVRRISAAKLTFTKMSQSPDGTGINLTVPGADQAAQVRKLADASGAHVTVTEDAQQSVPLAGPSRLNGQESGGALMVAPVCSTSFMIMRPQQQQKYQMLTADHCFNQGGTTRYRTNVDSSGSLTTGAAFGVRDGDQVGPLSGPVDVAAVAPLNGTQFTQSIWRGPQMGNSGQYKESVMAAQQPVIGNYICTDGARSGERCNAKITARLDYYEAINDQGHTDFYQLGWQAMSLNDKPIARRGDSGGPVIMAPNGGAAPARGGGVTALGVISSSAGRKFQCPDPPYTTCSTGVIFVGIDDAAFYLNASISLRNPKTGATTEESFTPHIPMSGSAPTPQSGEHDELVGPSGDALAWDPAAQAFVARRPTEPGTSWTVKQVPGFNWQFVNDGDPTAVYGGPWGVQVNNVGNGYAQLQLGPNCLSFDFSSAHPSMSLGGTRIVQCSSDLNQRFALAPVVSALSGDTKTPAPATQHRHMPSAP